MRKPYYRKRESKWYVKGLTAEGKPTEIALGKTKREAYDAWRAMMAASEASAGSASVLRIVGLFMEFMNSEHELGNLAAKTVSSRLLRLGPLCKYLYARHPKITVDELKPHHVRAFLDTRENWGATTRHDCVQDLKRAFNWAIAEGLIRANPIQTMKTKKGAPRDHVIDREEYEALIEEAGGSKFAGRHCRSFRTVLIASWLTGCRPSEIRRVKIENVTDNRWTIADHKTKGKTKRPRIVYLSACGRTLTRILAHGREKGPLFQPQPGKRWTYRQMNQRMKRLKKKSKKINRKCVLYSFRHTWITRAMLAGLDTGTVAAMAGTSIRMIDEHYGHLSQHQTHLDAAADRVAEKT